MPRHQPKRTYFKWDRLSPFNVFRRIWPYCLQSNLAINCLPAKDKYILKVLIFCESHVSSAAVETVFFHLRQTLNSSGIIWSKERADRFFLKLKAYNMVFGSYIPPFGQDITAQKAHFIPPTSHWPNRLWQKRWDVFVAQDETSNMTASDIESEITG